MNPRSLLITLSILLLPFLSMVSAAVPENWAAGNYAVGSLVIDEGTTYIAILQVTPSQGKPETTTAYWESLDSQASSKKKPSGFEELGTVDATSVPEKIPDSSGTGGTADTIQIFSLSTRAFFSSDGMSASLNLAGSSNEAKKVMFRVKGPSMNSKVITGPKLADPWIDVLSREATKGSPWGPEFESRTFGDHSSATGPYANRATGNNVEPMVVTSVTPSIFSCVVGSEIDGGTGNAIVEVYSMDDDNTSSYFTSLSTRGYFSTDGMSGSVRLVGTGKKKILFRVKGPSMNSKVIKGAKLADPKITLQHKTSDGWVKVVESSTFGAAYTDENLSYTNVTSNHVDRHTGNNLEPMVVFELEEGTYSCVIGSDIVGGEGNAILEIYTVD